MWDSYFQTGESDMSIFLLSFQWQTLLYCMGDQAKKHRNTISISDTDSRWTDKRILSTTLSFLPVTQTYIFHSTTFSLALFPCIYQIVRNDWLVYYIIISFFFVEITWNDAMFTFWHWAIFRSFMQMFWLNNQMVKLTTWGHQVQGVLAGDDVSQNLRLFKSYFRAWWVSVLSEFPSEEAQALSRAVTTAATMLYN